MKRSDALALFDSVADLARAIGITPQAVYLWPDELSPKIRDRVIAAAVRTGRDLSSLSTEQVA